MALAAVTARAAELASDVAAAVHAVELEKHWPQAPLLPPLVRSLLPLFQRVLPAVVPFTIFTSAAASWCALALPFLHPSQHLSFSFCKEKNPKTDDARSKKMAPAQRVMKRENRRWRRSRRIFSSVRSLQGRRVHTGAQGAQTHPSKRKGVICTQEETNRKMHLAAGAFAMRQARRSRRTALSGGAAHRTPLNFRQ